MRKIPSTIKAEEKRKAKLKQQQNMFAALETSPVGVDIVKFIYTRSGYSIPILALKDGEVSLNAMVYNEGRRSMYLDLRKFLSKEFLCKVENRE